MIEVGGVEYAEIMNLLKRRITEVLTDVPTIDLVLRDKENGIIYAPVRRGKWIEIDYPVSECSVCKYMVDTLNIATSYCPNCGAKMED